MALRSAFSQLEEELIELFETDYPQLQLCLENPLGIFKTYDEKFKSATTGSRHGKVAELAGGVMMVVGAALAPVTLGASALVAGAGAVAVTGGAIGQRGWNKKKKSMKTNFKQDLEAAMNEFQNKIIPMNNMMKNINRRLEEILRDINNPEHDVSYLSKYFAAGSELVRFIRKYDVGGLAAPISETVRLTENITGIVFRIRSVLLERVSVCDESEVLNDMRKEFNTLQTFMGTIRITTCGIINRGTTHSQK
ncbi:uncharacterized protein LOC107658682 [Sinocyclocheilus anshuiensis]|uniref:uncharacterized protein LOC107658682 n=1 Tax=Sinocyclocheilus anshuiensis TaxID=1608454 RepID=UPI0007B9A404|nr:PREDICTED: uncharacterized protein LOC107658682 [Sinocyclocheilus anshuiensis]